MGIQLITTGYSHCVKHIYTIIEEKSLNWQMKWHMVSYNQRKGKHLKRNSKRYLTNVEEHGNM